MGNLLVIKGADFSQSAISQNVIVRLSVSPAGSGSVSGEGRYNIGDSVVIYAISNSGYHFVKWSDDNIDNPRSFIASESLQLSAIFEQGEQITWYNDISSLVPNTNTYYFSGDGSQGPSSWNGYTTDGTIIIGQPINILSLKYKPRTSFAKDRYVFRLITFNDSGTLTSIVVLKQFYFSSEDAQAGEKQVRLDIPVTLVQGQRIFIGLADGDIPDDNEYIPVGRVASSDIGGPIGYINKNNKYDTTSGSLSLGYGFIQ